jgi:hypothetical protein
MLDIDCEALRDMPEVKEGILACVTCGSEDVRVEAWARFDRNVGGWVVTHLYPTFLCCSCDDLVQIIVV